MTEYAKKIKEKLNVVTLSNEDFDKLCKDRLDFGFDSIYFRYALIRDELAYEKARYSHDVEKEKRKAETDKAHFYMCLEQLIHAHEAEDK